MTGREALEQAMRLLGYTDGAGRTDSVQYAELYRRGLACLNQICADLATVEKQGEPAILDGLDRPVPLSARSARDILPYGLAMLLAGAEGDGDSQRLYAALYNQKRSAAPRRGDRVEDVLPRPAVD